MHLFTRKCRNIELLSAASVYTRFFGREWCRNACSTTDTMWKRGGRTVTSTLLMSHAAVDDLVEVQLCFERRAKTRDP